MFVISPLRLLLCTLCWVACCGIANAQSTMVFLPAPGEQVSVESNDPPVPNSAADFLKALRARTPVDVQKVVGLEDEVVVWPELVGLETAEAYSPTPIRYLAIHLRIANNSAKAIEIHPAKLVLSAGPEKLKAGELPERFPAYYIELGDEMLEMEKIRKQQPVQVEAGQVAQLWTVFAPVPELPIDIPLTLQVPWSTGATQLDLRAISNARNLQRLEPAARIEIVVNGTAAAAALDIDDEALKSLLVICQNSLQRQSLELPQDLRVVPAAVLYLALQQSKGWCYIRA